MKKIKTAFFILLLAPLSIAHARQNKIARMALSSKAAQMIDGDDELNHILELNPHLSFKMHGSFVEHEDLQSMRYHEVYFQTRDGQEPLQWEVEGAGVDTHYCPVSDRYTYGKHVKSWTNTPNIEEVLSKPEVAIKLTQYLGLPKTISLADFSLQKKLRVEKDKAKPIYWADVKARALLPLFQSGKWKTRDHAARTIIMNANDGTVLQNYSKRHYFDVMGNIPPIAVRDGTNNRAISTESSDATGNDAFVKSFQNKCQVVSNNEKNLGEAILINPNKCELVYKGDTRVKKGGKDSSSRAHDNTVTILNYFLNEHHQYGANNDRTKKTTITSIVHVGDHYDNAYWDPDLGIMAYGDGSGGNTDTDTHDYTYALDIAGHEFTHAIVSGSADFIGPGEPGALNEAFADIFGILVSHSTNPTDDWSIGKALYKNVPGTPIEQDMLLRSLSHPEKYQTSTFENGQYRNHPYPVKYSQITLADAECNDDNDQCDVHGNSTIWSHNAYLIQYDLNHKMNYTSDEADKIVGNLFFITLTHRLNSNSTMKEAAREVINTCHDLYKAGECAIVETAFKKTELI